MKRQARLSIPSSTPLWSLFVCFSVPVDLARMDRNLRKELACSYNLKKESGVRKKTHRNHYWDYQKLNIEAVMMLHCHSVLFAKKCPPGTV